MSIATAALLISILSLILSLYAVSKDRSRLKTESHAYRSQQTGEFSSMYIKAVNSGRRPVIITLVQGVYEGSHQSNVYTDYENKGIILNEGEFFEYRFGKYDGIMECDPEEQGDFFNLEDLFLVDSTGKKYHVKDAKKNIQLIKSSKHPLGVKF